MALLRITTLARMALVTSLLATPITGFAALEIVNNDGPGEGFNDPTEAPAVGGNSGLTLGAQRLAVFNKAAEILNQTFNISQTIQVDAQFDLLDCTATSAILGSAGPTYSYTHDDGTGDSLYPIALANELAGSDLVTGDQEIKATFNSGIGQTGCLASSSWYLGFDTPDSGTSLLSVVMHELMHGMGFLSFMGENGAAPDSSGGDIFDPYTEHLFDAARGSRLTDLTLAQRAAAIRNDGNLLWDGALLNSHVDHLTNGVNQGRAQMYAPQAYDEGSSVSHFDTDLSPNELMEPSYTEFLNDPGLAKYVLADIGWTLRSSGNTLPVWTQPTDMTLLSGGKASTQILSASDSDGDSLTFSVVSVPNELSARIDGTTLAVAAKAKTEGLFTLTLSVTDGKDTVQTNVAVTVLPQLTLSTAGSTRSDGAVISSDNSAVEFRLSGGDNTLTPILFFNGENRDDLFTYNSSNDTYTLSMPASGAFAGVYTLTVTDGNGFTADYYFERPLRLTPAITPLLVNPGANQTMTIEGAPANSVIALTSSHNTLTFANAHGTPITDVTATDDADSFNAVSVRLIPDDSIAEDFSAEIGAQASNIPDTSQNIAVQLPRSVTVRVQDSAGAAISNATVHIDDVRFALWGLADQATTDTNGQTTLTLPKESVRLHTRATGYGEKDSTVSAIAIQTSVTLTALQNVFTLSGVIHSSGFDFSNEQPLIALYFSNGNREILSSSAIDASTVRYSWQGDLNQQQPDYLLVSHSAASAITANIAITSDTQTLDIDLKDAGKTDTTDTTPGSSGGSGGGMMLEILLVLLTILMLPRAYSTVRPAAVIHRDRVD